MGLQVKWTHRGVIGNDDETNQTLELEGDSEACTRKGRFSTRKCLDHADWSLS